MGAGSAAQRFAKVIWVPGNHELWTTSQRPDADLRSGRYDYLVNICDETGRRHPGAPVPGVDRAGRPGDHRADVPALRLLVLAARARPPKPRDWRSRGSATSSAPTSSCCRRSRTPTREAWCRDRVAEDPQAARRARLDDADGAGQPLPDGAPTLRRDVLPGVLAVVRNHRDRRLAHPLQRGVFGLRASAHPAHHLVRRGPLRRGVGRLSTGVAPPQTVSAGCARCCPTRSTRPATSTTSVVISSSRPR